MSFGKAFSLRREVLKNFPEFSFKQVGHYVEGKNILLISANSDDNHDFYVKLL